MTAELLTVAEVAARELHPTDLLNMEDVARLFRVPLASVKRLHGGGNGVLPFRLVGRVLCLTRGEVEAWLDAATIASTARQRVSQPPRMPTRFTLYRFYSSDGTLLYVGITTAGVSRWTHHSKDKPWWLQVDTVRVEHYHSLVELRAAEVVAIRAQRPLHNVTHMPR